MSDQAADSLKTAAAAGIPASHAGHILDGAITLHLPYVLSLVTKELGSAAVADPVNPLASVASTVAKVVDAEMTRLLPHLQAFPSLGEELVSLATSKYAPNLKQAIVDVMTAKHKALLEAVVPS